MRRCSICDGLTAELALVITAPDRFERHAGVGEEGYRREWWVCDACGCAHNQLPHDSADKLAAMAEGYYHIDFPDVSPADRFRTIMSLPRDRSDNVGRVGRIRSYLQDWLPERRRSTLSVLDVGAGLGVFLTRFLAEERAEEITWNGMALEPDPDSASHLETLRDFEVRRVLLTQESNLGPFVLVTLNKVLEHVPDPRALILAAARVLDPADGLIYVEVPDVLTLGRRSATDNILGALHHHLYSPEALTMVFRAAGLVPMMLGRICEPSGKLTVYGLAASHRAFDIRAKTILR